MNKKHVVVAVLLVLFFVSAQTTQAFSLKAFFNNIFGKKAVPVEQKSSLGASVMNAETAVREESDASIEADIPTKSTTTSTSTIKVAEPVYVPVKSTTSETSTYVAPTKSTSTVFTTEEAPTVKPNTSSTQIKIPTEVSTIKPTKTDIPTSISQKVKVSKVVRYGMKNDVDVKTVQNQLKLKGYFTGESDGNYGKMTVASVIAFQKAYKIEVDGMAVGARTLPYLDIILVPAPTTEFPTGGIKPPKTTLPVITLDPTVPPSDTATAEKVLLVGGINASRTAYYNDVYASTDVNHSTWTLSSANSATTTTKWSQRETPEVLYFNNKFWVIGGGTMFDQPQYQLNDVWSSTDGVTWTRTASNVTFNTHDRTRLVALNGKMYAIDGSASGAKVYSSTDGATWITASSAPAFGSRGNFTAFAFNGKIYVLGGEGKSDLWSSTDGTTWTKVLDNASWGPRTNALVLVKSGKAFLIGGWKPDATGSSTNREIWSSTDGATWTMLSNNSGNLLVPTDGTNFFMYQHGFVADGKLWLSGSSGNNLWSSADGITWTASTAAIPWPIRSGYRYISTHTEPSTTVTPPPAPVLTGCTINSFTAPTSITSSVATNGGPSMTWSTSGCTKAWYLVNYGFGSTGGTLSTNGTQITGIGSAVAQNDTTYDITLYAASDTFVTSKSLTIPVTNTPGTDTAQCSINSFTGTPNPATSGQTVTLSWSSTNCPNVYITREKPNHILGISNLPSSGYFTTQTSTTVSATGPEVFTIIGVKNDGLNPHGPMNSLSSKAVNVTIQ